MDDNNIINNEPRKHVFDHSRLDAYRVLLEALALGERLARGVPRGFSTLVDQLRRAQQSALLQFVEGVARTGADRVSRLKCARAEACEAAACIEALKAVGVVKPDQAERVLELLWRACAMLTQLQRVGR